jgi:hypothetical protein
VVNGREGPVRVRDLEPKLADHRKSLRARDLMDQMRADEQLRLPVGEIADGVCVPYFLEECFTHSWKRNKQLLPHDAKDFALSGRGSTRQPPGGYGKDIMLEKLTPARENTEQMKLDLCLEYQGALVLIAWARETNLGVYMGARFSPEVENASYFKDGQRQLLQFPLMPDGKRKRREVLLESRPPIPAIQRSELIMGRLVNVAGDSQRHSPAPKASAGTTAITIPEAYLECFPCLFYEAHIVHNGYAEEFLADQESNSEAESDDRSFSMRLFPLESFPEHSLALGIQRRRSTPD